MSRSILLKGIKTAYQTRQMPLSPLRGDEMQQLPARQDISILISDGRIAELIPEGAATPDSDLVIDCSGRLVLPCWCDSHTHIVFARSREEEFVDRINGLSYEEIAERGGGILNSARRVAETSEDDLLKGAMSRLRENISQGTGAIEIKSGYGLSVESELKMLRVIKRMKAQAPIPVRSTFLGAHAYPMEYRGDHQGYIQLLINEMLPKIADEGLADYIDCFCENGFFSVEEAAVILEAGARYGLRPKIHVNQLSNSGGVQLGIRHNALSVDHLEEMSDTEIRLLAEHDTIATVLPSCSFFLNIPYAPARQLIDAGAALAIASDHNPGSTPSGNGQFLLSLACIKYRITPEEAVNALTINGAHAMELQNEAGVIAPGRPARLIITRPVPSLAYLPYAFGSDLIEKVVLPDEVIDKA